MSVAGFVMRQEAPDFHGPPAQHLNLIAAEGLIGDGTSFNQTSGSSRRGCLSADPTSLVLAGPADQTEKATSGARARAPAPRSAQSASSSQRSRRNDRERICWTLASVSPSRPAISGPVS